MMLPVGGPLEVTGLFRGMKGFMLSASNIPISLSLRWYVVSGGLKVGGGWPSFRQAVGRAIASSRLLHGRP